MQSRNNSNYRVSKGKGEMQLFKKVPFAFEQLVYEIRVYYSDAIINVVAFRNSFEPRIREK